MVDGMGRDVLQNLLEMGYQKLQARQAVHTHRCWACEEEMTCCCGDRRQVDRVTGKVRKLLCVGCIEVEAAVQADSLARERGE